MPDYPKNQMTSFTPLNMAVPLYCRKKAKRYIIGYNCWRFDVADPEFLRSLTSSGEVEITVTGRKSGRSISTPVWFVYEGGKLYLLPVKGSDSEWYKNVIAKPEIQISAKGRKVTVKADPISDAAKIKEEVEKFKSKYGAGEIKKYYSKLDAAIEALI